MLINIIGNSLKFTEKGRVLVKADWIPILAEEDLNNKELLETILMVSERKDFIHQAEGNKYIFICSEYEGEEEEYVPKHKILRYSQHEKEKVQIKSHSIISKVKYS